MLLVPEVACQFTIVEPQAPARLSLAGVVVPHCENLAFSPGTNTTLWEPQSLKQSQPLRKSVILYTESFWALGFAVYPAWKPC